MADKASCKSDVWIVAGADASTAGTVGKDAFCGLSLLGDDSISEFGAELPKAFTGVISSWISSSTTRRK